MYSGILPEHLLADLQSKLRAEKLSGNRNQENNTGQIAGTTVHQLYEQIVRVDN